MLFNLHTKGGRLSDCTLAASLFSNFPAQHVGVGEAEKPKTEYRPVKVGRGTWQLEPSQTLILHRTTWSVGRQTGHVVVKPTAIEAPVVGPASLFVSLSTGEIRSSHASINFICS